MTVVSRDTGHDGISSLRGRWIISSKYSLLLGTGPLVSLSVVGRGVKVGWG